MEGLVGLVEGLRGRWRDWEGRGGTGGGAEGWGGAGRDRWRAEGPGGAGGGAAGLVAVGLVETLLLVSMRGWR